MSELTKLRDKIEQHRTVSGGVQALIRGIIRALRGRSHAELHPILQDLDQNTTQLAEAVEANVTTQAVTGNQQLPPQPAEPTAPYPPPQGPGDSNP